MEWVAFNSFLCYDYLRTPVYSLSIHGEDERESTEGLGVAFTPVMEKRNVGASCVLLFSLLTCGPLLPRRAAEREYDACVLLATAN